MTSLHTDLDLTDAVEAAARHHWEHRNPALAPWDDVVTANPGLAHDIREHVLPAVTAAAPVIATAAIARAHTALDELAHERDEARQQVADLRAGIESVQKAIENNRGIDRAWDVLNALLSGSGEQPGEVDGYCTCHDDQKGRTRDCGVKVHREAGRPAPVVPDSTGVRSVVAARVAFEEAGVRLMAVAGADATRYLDALGRVVAAGATVGDIAALASPLAAVGQGVTAEQTRTEAAVPDSEDVRASRIESGGEPAALTPTPPTVKPTLEQVVDVLAAQPPGRGEWTSSRIMQTARAVLALFPGRTEAEVKAEALRDAADDVVAEEFLRALPPAEYGENAVESAADWLDVRAEHLANGGA